MSSRLLATNAILEELNGMPVYLGTIVATTTKNNADTATPFTIPNGCQLMLQSDAAFYYAAVSGASGTVTAANGVYGDTRPSMYFLRLTNEYKHIACLAVSGTANVKVFQLR